MRSEEKLTCSQYLNHESRFVRAVLAGKCSRVTTVTNVYNADMQRKEIMQNLSTSETRDNIAEFADEVREAVEGLDKETDTAWKALPLRKRILIRIASIWAMIFMPELTK